MRHTLGLVLSLVGSLGCASDEEPVSRRPVLLLNSAGQYVATAESTAAGGIQGSGSFADTQDLDGSVEILREGRDAGLDHTWTIDGLPTGAGDWTITVVAWRKASTGDDFVFA